MPILCATLKMQILRRGLNDGSEAIKELTPSNPWLISSVGREDTWACNLHSSLCTKIAPESSIGPLSSLIGYSLVNVRELKSEE